MRASKKSLIILFFMKVQNKPRLTLENFQESYLRNRQEKLLEEALVFLKLREYGCPKAKALYFVKKKQNGIDGTIIKDGPAGFRKLTPDRSENKLRHGWMVGEKHRYVGLKGYSEQIRKNVSPEKKTISAYNEKGRKQLQSLRREQKRASEGLLNSGKSRAVIEQITNLKDQFMKDKEKRNLFLSYSGVRLDQYTRDYFQRIEEVDPNSFIARLAAFSQPLNDSNINIERDWQVAKGRSLNSYQVEGQNKRKKVMNFRNTLSSMDLKQVGRDDKFRKTMSFSSKKLMSSSMGKKSLQKRQKLEKQFEGFNEDLQKIVQMTKRSQSHLSSKNDE